MNVTKKEMVAAFAEWNRLYGVNPDEFMSEEEELEVGPQAVGEYSMKFFVKLIKEARKA